VQNSIHPLVKLAKNAVEKFVSEGEIISPSSALPKELLEKKAGVFVSIRNSGNLRACIGTYLPTKKNIAIETIANAVSAASNDMRFEPITKKELPSLDYEVYVLGSPERIKDAAELDVKKYGILVESAESRKCGLLLPNLEGIKSIEEQISIAARKGGIDLGKEKIIIYRFTADKY
jgi:AmmeMemoRadiSam system protein A